MAFSAVNATTANLAANILREGRIVLVDPVEPFSNISGFVSLGLFPNDAVIAPVPNITRDTVRALNPEGGAPVVVAEPISDISIVYDIPVLTPDDTVRDLHNGAPPVALTDPDLVGVKISPFLPGASILTRMIVVCKRPGTSPTRLFRVFWHPRANLQSNSTGESQNQPTLIFRASVQAFTYTPSADFTDVAPQITQYGAIFTVPADKLESLLEKLALEAV